MALVPTTNFVKFTRGTPTAFQNLAVKNPDTLYFISELNSTKGKLYLGDKLIGGGDLSTLSDVIINAVDDRQLLVYDAELGAWKNAYVNDVIDIMVGADGLNNGAAGLVPTPQAGDQNKFLRGDGTWAEVEGDSIAFDDKVFAENAENEVTLVGFVNAPVGTLPQKSAEGSIEWIQKDVITGDLQEQVDNLSQIVHSWTGGLKRKIVASKEDIDVTAEDADQYIYLVPKTESADDDLYDEYIVIEGKLEKWSSGSTDLSLYAKKSEVADLKTELENKFNDYVLTSTFNTKVGDLSKLILTQDVGADLVSQVNDVTDRLTWYAITDEE